MRLTAFLTAGEEAEVRALARAGDRAVLHGLEVRDEGGEPVWRHLPEPAGTVRLRITPADTLSFTAGWAVVGAMSRLEAGFRPRPSQPGIAAGRIALDTLGGR